MGLIATDVSLVPGEFDAAVIDALASCPHPSDRKSSACLNSVPGESPRFFYQVLDFFIVGNLIRIDN